VTQPTIPDAHTREKLVNNLRTSRTSLQQFSHHLDAVLAKFEQLELSRKTSNTINK